MDISEGVSPTASHNLQLSFTGSSETTATCPHGQYGTNREICCLSQELNATKRELERARNDCHQMSYVLTSMGDYFMTDSGYDANTVVGTSFTDHKASIAPQPLVSFDDDNFSDYHNCQDDGPLNLQNKSAGSADGDLISLCASEPSTSWSSYATGGATQPSDIEDSSIRCDSVDGDVTTWTDDVLQDVACIGQDFKDLDLGSDEDIEEGEIIEPASEKVSEAMPATFWKYLPDSPHPRNFLNLGIRFDTETLDPENLKCVLIKNLPRGVELRRVLSHVRGGDVVACTLLPTADLQGYDAAYVQFKDANVAAEYADFAKSHPMFIGCFQMIVEHLQTPTYPLSPQLSDAVYRYGCTRCLRVLNIPRAVTTRTIYDALLRHFRTRSVIDSVHDDHTREAVIIRFSSVEVAGRAWWLLKHSGRYWGDRIDIEYLPDSCNLPLSTLLLKPGMRNRENGRWDPASYSPVMDY